MSETLILAVFVFCVGVLFGRLSHPDRREIERYAEEIHRRGVDAGYAEGWRDGRAGQLPRDLP